jgi:hypothetical protein
VALWHLGSSSLVFLAVLGAHRLGTVRLADQWRLRRTIDRAALTMAIVIAPVAMPLMSIAGRQIAALSRMT